MPATPSRRILYTNQKPDPEPQKPDPEPAARPIASEANNSFNTADNEDYAKGGGGINKEATSSTSVPTAEDTNNPTSGGGKASFKTAADEDFAQGDESDMEDFVEFAKNLGKHVPGSSECITNDINNLMKEAKAIINEGKDSFPHLFETEGKSKASKTRKEGKHNASKPRKEKKNNASKPRPKKKTRAKQKIGSSARKKAVGKDATEELATGATSGATLQSHATNDKATVKFRGGLEGETKRKFRKGEV